MGINLMGRPDSPGVLAQQLSALEQTRLVQDTKILQKVNAAHRVAFADKYPSQVEHCLRLVMERLQAGLDKRDGVDPGDPKTWRMSSLELQDLASAAAALHTIRASFPNAGS
jgi:hypothetical protein